MKTIPSAVLALLLLSHPLIASPAAVTNPPSLTLDRDITISLHNATSGAVVGTTSVKAGTEVHLIGETPTEYKIGYMGEELSIPKATPTPTPVPTATPTVTKDSDTSSAPSDSLAITQDMQPLKGAMPVGGSYAALPHYDFISMGYKECVGFVKGRAYEKLGIQLGSFGGGGSTAIQTLRNQYPIINPEDAPKENTLACFSSPWNPHGHVAFIEKTIKSPNGYEVFFTEANVRSPGYTGQVEHTSWESFKHLDGRTLIGLVDLGANKDNSSPKNNTTPILTPAPIPVTTSAQTKSTKSTLSKEDQIKMEKENIKALWNAGKHLEAIKQAAEQEHTFVISELENAEVKNIKAVWDAGNHSQAIQLYKQAAEQGNAGAVGELESLLETPDASGITKEQVVDLMIKASQSNDSCLLAHLGDLYAEGKLVPKNTEKYIQYYSQCAEQGIGTGFPYSEMCAIRLFEIYFTGEGVEKSLPKAKYWLEKSGDDGSFSESTDYEIGNFYVAMAEASSDPKQADALYAKAVTYYKSVTDGVDEYDKALLALGNLYATGKGVPKDMVQGKKLWQQAADHGNDEAKKKLL